MPKAFEITEIPNIADLPKVNDYSLIFTKRAGKSDTPEMLVRNATLAQNSTRLLLSIKQELQKRWGAWFQWDGMYTISPRMGMWANAEHHIFPVIIPDLYGSQKVILQNGMQIVAAGEQQYWATPKEYVNGQFVLKFAQAMSWPDNKGKVKLWMHRQSAVVQFRYNTEYVEGPDVDMKRFGETTSWEPLADYLETGKEYAVKQEIVCQIVRKISANISKKKMEEDMEKSQVNNVKNAWL